jgi:hypothetical protein
MARSSVGSNTTLNTMPSKPDWLSFLKTILGAVWRTNTQGAAQKAAAARIGRPTFVTTEVSLVDRNALRQRDVSKIN